MAAKSSSTWQCPQCKRKVDTSALGFFVRVKCEGCGYDGEHANTKLGNFHIERVQGIGGMSIVLQARDVVLDRPVALKMLNDTYKESPDRVARFELECSLMARVRHKHVVSLYTAGQANHHFYLAMEFIDGQNLEDLISPETPIKPERALQIISQVAMGLRAANQAGVMHRDMKPGNILLTSSGVAKVVDFGLSMQSQDDNVEEIIWATPFYVPPETLTREPEDVRADIYALGMTLRHMLTGSDFLDADSSSVTSLLEAKEKLPSIAQQMPELDVQTVKLVNAMTAFSPEKRPLNYDKLLALINAILDTPKRQRQMRRAVKFKRKYLISSIAGCLGLAGLAALCTHKSYPPLPQPKTPQLTPVAQKLPLAYGQKWAQEFRVLCAQSNWVAAYQLCEQYAKQYEQDALFSSYLSQIAVLTSMIAGADPVPHLKNFRDKSKKFQNQASVSEGDNSIAAQLQHLLANPEARIQDTSSLPEELRLFELANRAITLFAKANEAQFAITDAPAAFRVLLDSLPHLFTKPQVTQDALANFLLKRNKQRKLAFFFIKRPQCNWGEFHELMLHTKPDELWSELQKREYGLMEEWMKIYQSFHQKLSSKSISMDSQEASFAVIQETAKKLLPFQKAIELNCIELMLKGDYKAAKELNPYKDKLDAREPFAVLMRDWEERIAQLNH